MSTTYPKTLAHPSYKPAEVKAVPVTSSITGRTIIDHYGTPDRYPPVTVNNEDQEERHRAMGYIEYGEAPKPMIEFSEFPLMLTHPGHIPAVEQQVFATRDQNTGAVTTHTIAGSPAKLPAVVVKNSREEETWAAKGYVRPGRADPDAVQASKASPHVPGRVVEEFPKMVDGKVVDPRPNPHGFQKYPMWMNGIIVNNEAEELAAGGVAKPIAAAAPVAPPSVDAAEHAKVLGELETLRARLAAAEKPRNKGGRPRKVKLAENQSAA